MSTFLWQFQKPTKPRLYSWCSYGIEPFGETHAFGVLGVSLSEYLPLILTMIFCAFFGNYIGRYFLNKMPERWFRIIFKLFMTALAIRLLFVAGSEYLVGV